MCSRAQEGYGNFQSPANNVGACQKGVLGDAESVAAGNSVNNFDREGIPLKSPVDWVGQCKNNAVMCCWPRDRQCGDNNGNCNTNGCEDSDPADNTNLCYMNAQKNTYPHLAGGVKADVFLGQSEGDLHCHGFAWSDDLNDISARYAGSNFFFVSMYDHMYTRGYVGALPQQPMCTCLEDMHPMSRSDCTELAYGGAQSSHSIKFEWGGDQLKLVNTRKVTGNKLQFNTCQGTKRTNDLYEHMDRLMKQGKLSKDKVEEAKKYLYGWRNTNVSVCARSMYFAALSHIILLQDNEREDDCRNLLINY